VVKTAFTSGADHAADGHGVRIAIRHLREFSSIRHETVEPGLVKQ
jgi:hypothetical protein